MKKNYKRIPFDIDRAKRITEGKENGRIVTTYGQKVRIICFDKKHEGLYKEYPIVALVGYENGEIVEIFNKQGYQPFENIELCIKIPTYHKDYSNFVPHKWQICLVRDSVDEHWKICVCKCKDAYGVPRFYEYDVTYSHILPFNKVTERLLGTKQSYEQLIEELDKEL